ncbi:hypothetical protein ACMD2_21179 [Ananas comosus]|uniref:Uncharacterized protein n=1 Tax=Ananas comosus TaxID=4615 RepID=A0A199W6T5_ANACO|nr:hypothetical protein ACMD2_21179 [Ananas comosus]
MVKFKRRELIRLGITRFATNLIALNSILQNKNGLKSISASDDWQTSRYASMADGKSIEQIILSIKRWDIQMIRDLHLAGYYLNPSYHHRYNLGFDDELFKALRDVINRLERDPTHVALAISKTPYLIGYKIEIIKRTHYSMSLEIHHDHSE